MREIWYGVYIANVVLVYLITPFALFYYEADSELCAPLPPGSPHDLSPPSSALETLTPTELCCRTFAKRLRSALIYTGLAILVFGIIFVLIYAINGMVEYDATLLTSGLGTVQDLQASMEVGCTLPSDGSEPACSALADVVRMEVRCTADRTGESLCFENRGPL